MRGRYHVGNGLNKGRIRRPGFCQMVESLTFVETGHFNGKFHRCAVSVDIKRSVLPLRDRDNAAVDLRRELPVYSHLLVAGGFSLRQRRIVQIREMHGALDLQRAVAFEKN